MAVVTVQLGQCGNQIGSKLFSTLLSDADQKHTGISTTQDQDYVDTVQERFFAISPKSGQLR